MPSPTRTLPRTGSLVALDAGTPFGGPAKVPPTRLLAPPRTGRTGRARRWDEVDRRLEARGTTAFLIDPDLLRGGTRGQGVGAGRGRPYEQALIDAINLVGTALGMPIRQRRGWARENLPRWGYAGPIPGRSTLWRRSLEMVFSPYLIEEARRGKVVMAIDGSGLALRSTSSWRRYRHGGAYLQDWVKIHVGIDSQTGGWLALEVTGSSGEGSGDVTQGPGLIARGAEVTGGLSCVIADRAYDAKTCYQAAQDAGGRLLCIPKTGSTYGLHPHRDEHKAQLGRIGEARWKLYTGYGQRAHIEGAFSLDKRIFHDQLRARTLKGARAEIILRANLWNAWRQRETAGR